MVPYPRKATKSGLARKLHRSYPDQYQDERRTEKIVARTWGVIKQHGGSVNGKVTPLIRREGSRYSGNLRYIVRQLRPGFDKRQVIEWERGFLSGMLRPQ